MDLTELLNGPSDRDVVLRVKNAAGQERDERAPERKRRLPTQAAAPALGAHREAQTGKDKDDEQAAPNPMDCVVKYFPQELA